MWLQFLGKLIESASLIYLNQCIHTKAMDSGADRAPSTAPIIDHFLKNNNYKTLWSPNEPTEYPFTNKWTLTNKENINYKRENICAL